MHNAVEMWHFDQYRLLNFNLRHPSVVEFKKKTKQIDSFIIKTVYFAFPAILQFTFRIRLPGDLKKKIKRFVYFQKNKFS